MRHVLHKTVKFMDYVIEWTCFALVCLISALLISQVAFRYILQAPPFWTEELSRYLYVWLSFTGTALAMRRGMHIMIPIFLDLLPAKARKVVNNGIRVITISLFAYLSFFGIKALEFTKLKSAALGIDMRLVYASLPVVLSLMILLIVAEWIGEAGEPQEAKGDSR